MKRNNELKRREQLIYELSKNNKWYQYERFKKYPDPSQRGVGIETLTKDLKI